MSDNICPSCDKELEWDSGYVCRQCDQRYRKIAHCPECGHELEKLQACGAASYFCNTCNELKSKSRLQFEFVALSE